MRLISRRCLFIFSYTSQSVIVAHAGFAPSWSLFDRRMCFSWVASWGCTSRRMRRPEVFSVPVEKPRGWMASWGKDISVILLWFLRNWVR